MDAGVCDVIADLRARGGRPGLEKIVGEVLKESFDTVINGPKTGRWDIDSLEKTEKTYIGTRVEIMFRSALDIERGQLLDYKIGEYEVDMKFSLSENWMIPREAFGHICIVCSASPKNGRYSLGVVRADEAILSKSENRDKKKHITASGKKNIQWAVKEGLLPLTMIYRLDHNTRARIFRFGSGQQRVNELFRLVRNQVIDRHTIEIVAQQKDSLKRVRANGGARETLLQEGIVILSGKYDKMALASVGFMGVGLDEFVSVDEESINIVDIQSMDMSGS